MTGFSLGIGIGLNSRRNASSGEGPELLTSPPSLGTGWSGSGPWTKTAGTAAGLSWTLSLTAGVSYILRFDITRTAGSLTPSFQGGTPVAFSSVAITSSVEEIRAAVTGNTSLLLNGNASFAGTISNVSLKALS